MKAFEELEVVALTRALPEHERLTGDWGTNVHAYDARHFELEFVEEEGYTRALVTLSADDVRHITRGEEERPRLLSSPALKTTAE